MILSALHIANFKAFATAQRLPLRPITLIYGANQRGEIEHPACPGVGAPCDRDRRPRHATDSDRAEKSSTSVGFGNTFTRRDREDLSLAARTFVPKALRELVGGLGSAIEGEIRRLRYLGPLRSYPPRHLTFTQHHDPNWFAGGGYAWDVLPSLPSRCRLSARSNASSRVRFSPLDTRAAGVLRPFARRSGTRMAMLLSA